VIQDSAEVSTYSKVPFEWNRASSILDRHERDGLTWLTTEGDERLIAVVAQVLTGSPDASDVSNVGEMGEVGAARDMIRAAPDWGCSHESGWWQLLISHGHVAGFVLPVTYDNCVRDGLDEGTIFHMGVLPDHRGQGLGRSLLRQATRTMLGHGVWRIYCDTALNNAPMIHLFETEGWTRLPVHRQPVKRPWQPAWPVSARRSRPTRPAPGA
jgi:ribosomal protein S18 acetylase RimI-like enzyme